jgi:hypothetical protein
MPYKHQAGSYRVRRGIKYLCAEYGLDREQADAMVAKYRADNVDAFKERDRYIGDGDLFMVFVVTPWRIDCNGL